MPKREKNVSFLESSSLSLSLSFYLFFFFVCVCVFGFASERKRKRKPNPVIHSGGHKEQVQGWPADVFGGGGGSDAQPEDPIRVI